MYNIRRRAKTQVFTFVVRLYTKSEQTSMKTGETGLMYSSSTLMDTTISTIVHPAIQYQTVLH